jgi:hypothetical protein
MNWVFISQKTPFFIVTAVKNLKSYSWIKITQQRRVHTGVQNDATWFDRILRK